MNLLPAHVEPPELPHLLTLVTRYYADHFEDWCGDVMLRRNVYLNGVIPFVRYNLQSWRFNFNALDSEIGFTENPEGQHSEEAPPVVLCRQFRS